MPDLEMLLRDVRPTPTPEWTDEAGREGRRPVSPPGAGLEAEAARAARPLRRALAGHGDRRRAAGGRDRDRQERRHGRRRLRLLERRWRRRSHLGQLRGLEREFVGTRGGEAGGSVEHREPRQRGRGRTPGRRPRRDRQRLADAHDGRRRRRVRRPTARSASPTRSAATCENSTSSREGSRATATLTLKLPSDKLDEGIAQISKLAHVQSRAQDTEDVTDQRAVLQSAVRDARADRARAARPPQQGDHRQGALAAARAAGPGLAARDRGASARSPRSTSRSPTRRWRSRSAAPARAARRP